MTQAMYLDEKAALEDVQRLPDKFRQEILTMLRGAIVISDMYVAASTPHTEQPSA